MSIIESRDSFSILCRAKFNFRWFHRTDAFKCNYNSIIHLLTQIRQRSMESELNETCYVCWDVSTEWICSSICIVSNIFHDECHWSLSVVRRVIQRLLDEESQENGLARIYHPIRPWDVPMVLGQRRRQVDVTVHIWSIVAIVSSLTFIIVECG